MKRILFPFIILSLSFTTETLPLQGTIEGCVLPIQAKPFVEMAVPKPGGQPGDTIHRTFHADADGHFKILHASPGYHELIYAAETPGYRRRIRTVEVTQGQTVNADTMVLTLVQ